MAAQVATTEAVLKHHLDQIFARNVEGIMRDYSDESVIFTPQGVHKGLEQIRAFFNYGVTNVLTPEVIGAIKIARQEVDGDFAYIFYSAPPKILMASDSFCIRDGKIQMQGFAGYMAF